MKSQKTITEEYAGLRGESDIHHLRNEMTLIKAYVTALPEAKGEERDNLVARYNNNVLKAIAGIESRLSFASGRSLFEKLRLIIQKKSQLF